MALLSVRVHGAVRGALVTHTAGAPLSGEDLATLRAYAALAAPLVASLSGEQEAGRSQLDKLSEIARVVGSGGDARALLREVCLKTAELCQADRCAVFLWNAATGEVTPATSQMVRDVAEPGAWERFKAMARRRAGKMPFVDAVARARRPLAIADARGSELVHQDWVTAFGVKSLLGVPLISGGQVFGALVLDNASRKRTGQGLDLPVRPAIRPRLGAGPDRSASWGVAELRMPQEALRARFRILMADDDAVNRMIITRQLEILGYRCTVVDNGSGGRDRFLPGALRRSVDGLPHAGDGWLRGDAPPAPARQIAATYRSSR